VNDYKAVIIPLKYDFLKSENQYRLQTLTKVNLVKAGFQAFYSNETIPAEFNERCSLLYVDIKNEKAFLATKLFITFKDCTGAIIFQSEIGKSKEKDSLTEVKTDLDMEIDFIEGLIEEYQVMPNKTQKEWDNKQMLEIKLEQLKRKL